jgi:hypothetical protein
VFVCVEDRLGFVCVNAGDMSIFTKTREELQYIMNRYYWENGAVMFPRSGEFDFADAHVVYSARDEKYHVIIYSETGVFFSLKMCIMEYNENGWAEVSAFELYAESEFALRQQINYAMPALNMSLLPSFSMTEAMANLAGSKDIVWDFVSEMSITDYEYISGASRNDGSYIAFVAYDTDDIQQYQLFIFVMNNPLAGTLQPKYSVELHLQTQAEIERLLGVNFGFLMIK